MKRISRILVVLLMLVIVGGVVGVSTAMQKQNVDVPIKPP